ncbi:MAG: hypothetical protein IT436_07660 [Phycisphaerales bacterium]|nr:hypothetical protein [Phycisphaerales bacterium]
MSTAGAAAAAAAMARRKREEEETMSGYSHADLAEDWEFKILRSATSAFRDPARLRQALEAESRAGWVLVEKFDNQRVRLKRPASARAGDSSLGLDPYRTSFGISEGRLTTMIVATIIGCIAVIMLIIFLAVRP